jgi:hypothetical protein
VLDGGPDTRRELTELPYRDGTPRERKGTEADVVVCLFSKLVERDMWLLVAAVGIRGSELRESTWILLILTVPSQRLTENLTRFFGLSQDPMNLMFSKSSTIPYVRSIK